MKSILLICSILLVSACSSLPHAIEPNQGNNGNIRDDIYVVSHGWHTGFVIPASLMHTRIPELLIRFPDAPYIEFGWGDKGFYQSEEITTGLTVKAIFWPTESVVHAVAVPDNAYQYFPNSHVQKLCLNENEYSSLIRFIENSFARDAAGSVIGLRNGIYGNSQFYQGQGDYYLMNTCNKWTAKGLKSAGMNINPTFKLTAGSIIDYLTANSSTHQHNHCKPSP